MNQSLCELCQHRQVVNTPRGSRFLLCQLSFGNPRYPKYPPQPIQLCQGFQSLSQEIEHRPTRE